VRFLALTFALFFWSLAAIVTVLSLAGLLLMIARPDQVVDWFGPLDLLLVWIQAAGILTLLALIAGGSAGRNDS
jgi:hypothetical protein